MKLGNLKRIIKEDFEQKDQALVEKLAYAINPFLEQVSNAFNKNIDIDNLSQEDVTFTVNNTGGRLTPSVQIKTTLKRKIVGFQVIRAINLTNSNTYPTSAPWLSWSVNGNLITIENVTGIQDNNKYQITVRLLT